MTALELKVMIDLVTAVKFEMLGIHLVQDWSPKFRSTITNCENLIIEETARHKAAKAKIGIYEVPIVIDGGEV
jgi:hypothetical protein